MYDQTVIDDFGVCDLTGELTALGEYYKQRLGFGGVNALSNPTLINSNEIRRRWRTV
jgi:hypothetical protein